MAGKVIAVTSPKHQQGISTTSITLGYWLMNNTDKNILIMDYNFMYNDIEKRLAIQSDTNIDDLIMLAKSNKLTPEIFRKYVHNIQGNLSMLCGSKMPDARYINSNIDKIEQIMKIAKNTYDIIIVDTIANPNNQLTNNVVDNSDLNMFIVTQDDLVLESQEQTYKDITNKITVVNKYTEKLYPDSKQIAKQYNIKNPYTLPFSAELGALLNTKNMKALFDEETKYTIALETLGDMVIQILEIQKNKEIKKKTRFKWFS